ncbi:hypothetical protein [Streptomyces sp. CB03911]|uniref:hypothetical protein n=1 Tax=Streptomyces sp. CB03911 TaxID=1804758 RepID=UPI0018FE584A|nr:hypothetical protein [Streptomyces sp. CB03911]
MRLPRRPAQAARRPLPPAGRRPPPRRLKVRRRQPLLPRPPPAHHPPRRLPKKKAAKKALHQYLTGECPGYHDDPSQTLAHYLTDWLAAKEIQLKPTTLARCRTYVLDGLNHHPSPSPRPPGRTATFRSTRDQAQPADGLVFTRNGRRLHPQYVLNRFHALCRAAGVPKIALHDLRDLAVTLAMDAGTERPSSPRPSATRRSRPP